MSQPIIRVAYVIDCLYAAAGGGTERQFLRMYELLPTINVEAEVVFLQDASIYQQLPWRRKPLILDASVRNGAIIAAPARLRKSLREWRIDVVHTFYDRSAVLSALATGGGRRVRLITSLRNMGYAHGAIKRRFMGLTYRRSNAVMVNSEAIADRLCTDYGVPRQRINVIPNIRLSEDSNAGKIPKELTELRSRFDTIVVSVTNLREVKGIRELVEAAAEIDIQSRIGIIVIGEGDRRAEYESLATTLGVSDRVQFVGWSDNVQGYLRGADIAVLPSRSEGLSNSLIEYSLAGLPIVATNVGGNPEVLGHGRRGILVPPQSASELALAISAFAKDPERRLLLGEAARAHATAAYAPGAVMTSLRNLYESVLRG